MWTSYLLVIAVAFSCSGSAQGNLVLTFDSSLLSLIESFVGNLSASLNTTIELGDFDECDTTDSFPCDVNALCSNFISSYNCTCFEGYLDVSNNTGKICEDINECLEVGVCDEETSFCENLNGSFACNCLSGFQLNEDTDTCEDVDECIDSEAACGDLVENYQCLNTHGSFDCSCIAGYELSDGICEEAGECGVFEVVKDSARIMLYQLKYDEITESEAFAQVASITTSLFNTVGNDNSLHYLFPDISSDLINDLVAYMPCDFSANCSYETTDLCTCLPGFEGSGTECSDVDECFLDTHNCDPNAGHCYNTIGSYECECEEGYIGSGYLGDCRDLDEPFLTTFVQAHGLYKVEVPSFVALALNQSRPAEGLCPGDLEVTDCNGNCRRTCEDRVCTAECSPGCACNNGSVRTSSESAYCKPEADCPEPVEGFLGAALAFEPALKDVTLLDWWSCISTRMSDYSGFDSSYMEVWHFTELFREVAHDCVTFPDEVSFDKTIHFSTYKAVVDEFIYSLNSVDIEITISQIADSISDSCVYPDVGPLCADATDVAGILISDVLPCALRQLKSGYALPYFTTLGDILNYIADDVVYHCLDEADFLDFSTILFQTFPAFDSYLGEISGSVVDLYPGFESLVYPPALPITLLTRMTPNDVENFHDYIDYWAIDSALNGYNDAYPGEAIAETADDLAFELYNLVHDQSFFAIVSNNPLNFGYPFTNLTEFMDRPSFFKSFTVCSTVATGSNLPGSYHCTCSAGYEGDGVGSDGCHDVDECDLELHSCGDNAHCINIDGGNNCSCNSGYTGDGYNCTDVNECEADENRCDVHATCVNDDGWYSCNCDWNYEDVNFDGTYCEPYSGCTPNITISGDNLPCDLNNESLSCEMQTEYGTKGKGVLKTYTWFLQTPAEVPANCEITLESGSFESSNPFDELDNNVPNPFGELTNPLPDAQQELLRDKFRNPALALSVEALLNGRFRRDVSTGGEPLCEEVERVTYRTKARRYADSDEEVELFHYEGQFQWFTEVLCNNTDTCMGSRLGCQQSYSPQKAVVITRVGTKLDVQLTNVYIPSACLPMLQ